jgi:glutaconate CoA-transferase, subunit B
MSRDRPPPDPRRDAMVAAMAREITDGDLVGVGLGTPLAVLAALLARSDHAPDSHVLVGGAVDPDADLEACLRAPPGLEGRTAGFVPHLDTMYQAERRAMTLQFLRPAQTDGTGAINVSWIRSDDRPPVRLPGGLAGADVPRLLPRLVVHLPTHERRSLPARVDVVTGAGSSLGDGPTRGVVAIITGLAVIRIGPDGPRLESCHDGVTPEEVQAVTGFHLDASDVAVTVPPTAEQRSLLERLDPLGRRHVAR